MKINSKDFILRLILTMLLMSACFIIIDLYVPLKHFLFGERLMLSEILSYIKMQQHLPIIIAVSIALSFENTKKNK